MGGILTQWLAHLLPDPAAPALIPNVPKKNSEENFVNVAEVNQWRCLEQSGQWLENVDWTHLALASGKVVLQKVLNKPSSPESSVRCRQTQNSEPEIFQKKLWTFWFCIFHFLIEGTSRWSCGAKTILIPAGRRANSWHRAHLDRWTQDPPLQLNCQ